MSVSQIFRRWSHRRQLLGKESSDALSVLERIIGVYSAHPFGPISLFARMKSLSADDFRTLDREQKVLRVPAMRQSI